MITYKIILDPITGNPSNAVFRSDNTSVPFDPDNTDYQQYLKWLEEGNTPLPPDEPPQGQ